MFSLNSFKYLKEHVILYFLNPFLQGKEHKRSTEIKDSI